MTNEITIFNFNQNAIRTQAIDGNAWFCLLDACDAPRSSIRNESKRDINIDFSVKPESSTTEIIYAGIGDTLRENRKIKDSLVIFGGQGLMTIGGYFGEDSKITQWGKELIQSATRNLERIEADNEKKRYPVEEEERQSLTYYISKVTTIIFILGIIGAYIYFILHIFLRIKP